MKRIIYLTLLLSLVSALLPFHFLRSAAQADEPMKFKNGVYPVELSFLSLEAMEQDELFSKHAMLIVHEGRYVVSVPMKPENGITAMSAKQQDTEISTRLDRVENLVQFDLKDVKQKIVIEGAVKLPSDEKTGAFSKELAIDFETLPEREQSPKNDTERKSNLINYSLLKDGKEELSVMQTYVNPVMKIIKKDDRFYAQMEILQSSWIRGLSVEQRGKMVEPTIISQDENKRLIEFEVEDFQKKIRLWSEVEIPELTYSASYFVQLQFDGKQAKKFLNEVEKPTRKMSNEKKTPLVRKTRQQSEPIRSSKNNPQPSPTVITPKEAPTDEQLVFDRTLDAKAENPKVPVKQVAEEEMKAEQAAYNPKEQALPIDLLKIGFLFSICILSAILLIRRVISGKKEVIEEQ